MFDTKTYFIAIVIIVVLVKLFSWVPLFRKNIIQTGFFKTFFKWYGSNYFANNNRKKLFIFYYINNIANVIFWLAIALYASSFVFDNKLWAND